MRSPGAVRGCVSIAVCQGLVWVPPCAVLSRGKRQRPRGSKSQDYFPKLFDLSRSNLAAFFSARNLFAAGFSTYVSEINLFRPLSLSGETLCVGLMGGREAEVAPGDRGMPSAEWVGAAQPLGGGRGTAERKRCCQRKCLLARLIWKGILPRRGTRADEMRGTFWDLTNMLHYRFGPQTTEGFVIYFFFRKPGEVAAITVAL